MKPVRLDREAEDEVEAAFRWYEERAPGLGADFLDDLERLLERLAAAPATFPLAAGVSRRLKVPRAMARRFPYAALFVELATEVRVLAVAHQARRPGYWRRRVVH